MSLFGGIDAAASGLTAERLRMDVISNNIANANTTRTAEGGAFKRKYVVFEPRVESEPNFARILAGEILPPRDLVGKGVRATRIGTDDTPGTMVYDPGHPDANRDGYVEKPNINIVAEMVDMITASRGYEANVTVINAAKTMAQSALDIGKG